LKEVILPDILYFVSSVKGLRIKEKLLFVTPPGLPLQAKHCSSRAARMQRHLLHARPHDPGPSSCKRQHPAGAKHGDENMTKNNLTDHQRCALRAASRSANLNVWPLPQRLGLSRGSATIVVNGLLKKGLIEERAALGHDAIWREAEDGRPMTLVITKAGLAAVGILPETEAEQTPATDDPTQKADNAAQSGSTAAVSENPRRMPRARSKLAMLVELLEREGSVTVEEAAAVLGWQAHTVRGVMSGALVKRFGLVIVSEVVEGRGRAYRIEGAAEAGTDEIDAGE
jgi:hypothetical protein